MNKPEKKELITPLSMIQRIKSGQLNPRILKKRERQECVEAFLAEGYSKMHMAEILKCSTKTIQRDKNEIRERNASEIDASFHKRMVGGLLSVAENHRNHLMRLARDKNASVMEREQAEYLAFRVFCEKFKILQKLGYFGLGNHALDKGGNTHFQSKSGNTNTYSQSQTGNAELPEEMTEEKLQRFERNVKILRRHFEREKRKENENSGG